MSPTNYTQPAPQGMLDPSLKKRIGYVSENEYTPEDRCYVMGLAAARVPSETIYKEVCTAKLFHISVSGADYGSAVYPLVSYQRFWAKHGRIPRNIKVELKN